MGQVGTKLGQVGAKLGQVGAKIGQVGAKWGPSGTRWTKMEDKRARLGQVGALRQKNLLTTFGSRPSGLTRGATGLEFDSMDSICQ